MAFTIDAAQQPKLKEFVDGIREKATEINSAALASVIIHKAFAVLIYSRSDARCFEKRDGDIEAIGDLSFRFQIISAPTANEDPPTVKVFDRDGTGTSYTERFVSYIYRVFGDLYKSDVEEAVVGLVRLSASEWHHPTRSSDRSAANSSYS